MSEAGIKRIVIDVDGHCWPPDDWETARQIGAPFVGNSLSAYTISNLGWVDLTIGGHHARLRCRPAIVADAAIAQALYAMDDVGTRTITLSVLGEALIDYIHCRPQDVITIVTAMKGLNEPPRVDCSTKKLLNRIVARDKSVLFAAFRRFEAGAPQTLTRTSIADCLNNAFNGRWTLSKSDLENGAAIVELCGADFTRFNPRWSSNAVGASLHSYADADYGSWVASHRRHVENLQRPLFDNVDAIVTFPGLGKVRLTYARVTAPITLASGERFVLSAASSDCSINLRSKIGIAKQHHIAN
jgi:hypothetical protein